MHNLMSLTDIEKMFKKNSNKYFVDPSIGFLITNKEQVVGTFTCSAKVKKQRNPNL